MNLLYNGIHYEDNFLTFNDVFKLAEVSKECTKLSLWYLDTSNMFRIYAAGSIKPNEDKKLYITQKLNNKKIKHLWIYDHIKEDDIFIEFAVKCHNIRSLYVKYIYTYISSTLHNLINLESIYLKDGLNQVDYTILKSLPSIQLIEFTYDMDELILLVMYHKINHGYDNIVKYNGVILCCDHPFKNHVTETCREFKNTLKKNQKTCKIIDPLQITQYLIK